MDWFLSYLLDRLPVFNRTQPMVDPENWTTREECVGMETGGVHTMARQRTKWNKATKFKIALEAYKGDRSVIDIAEEYGVHPTQVHRWKKE